MIIAAPIGKLMKNAQCQPRVSVMNRTRQVSAQCKGGILRVSQPSSPSLKTTGGFTDRLKEPGYNLFYADTEADALGRVVALMALPDAPKPAVFISPAAAPSPARAGYNRTRAKFPRRRRRSEQGQRRKQRHWPKRDHS